MADKVLKDHRIKLKDGLTLTVVKQLLDDLMQESVLNRDEADSIDEENSARVNKARSLIDSVVKKGSTASQIMLEKLKKHDPHLYNELNLDKHLHERPAPGTPQGPPMKSPVPTCSDQETDEEYKMGSIPRGFCLIINNFDFGDPEKNRYGSEYDEEALKKVFKFLGFKVKLYRDLKAEAMERLILRYSKSESHGDCFVCCVLSHGSKKGVCGVDWKLCTMKDILSPFDGENCQSLIGKPKVFFIQACRGRKREKEVLVMDDAAELDDTTEFYTIGSQSDFLVSMSTVEDYVSYRRSFGSFFIQSLCPLLEDGSLRGEDILSILTKVHDEVNRKEGKKMTPELLSRLRKKLIFRVPSNLSRP